MTRGGGGRSPEFLYHQRLAEEKGGGRQRCILSSVVGLRRLGKAILGSGWMGGREASTVFLPRASSYSFSPSERHRDAPSVARVGMRGCMGIEGPLFFGRREGGCGRWVGQSPFVGRRGKESVRDQSRGKGITKKDGREKVANFSSDFDGDFFPSTMVWGECRFPTFLR